jgi:hypothetical protein
MGPSWVVVNSARVKVGCKMRRNADGGHGVGLLVHRLLVVPQIGSEWVTNLVQRAVSRHCTREDNPKCWRRMVQTRVPGKMLYWE